MLPAATGFWWVANLVGARRCCSLCHIPNRQFSLRGSVLGGEGRIKRFLRDGWAKPWPPGPEMLCYMLAHEAHHRGQVFMLAHQLGLPLPHEVMYGLWNWDKLWKECGSPGGPGADL